MKEMAIDCDTVCAGSAQPPASRQWALHICRPQSLRIRVELHPITGHEDFRRATEGAGKRPCKPPLGCVNAGAGSWIVEPRRGEREGVRAPGSQLKKLQVTPVSGLVSVHCTMVRIMVGLRIIAYKSTHLREIAPLVPIGI